MQDALRHYEEAQKIKAPPNVDEAGIRALVNDLLPGGKDRFAERKLRLLGQRAVPALVSALNDPRFLQKPKKSNSLFEHAPLETVLSLLEPFAPPEAVAPLTLMLHSPDKYVRQTAALALGSIGTDECIEPMKASLADLSEEVRSRAMMGVERGIKKSAGLQNFLARCSMRSCPCWINRGKCSPILQRHC